MESSEEKKMKGKELRLDEKSYRMRTEIIQMFAHNYIGEYEKVKRMVEKNPMFSSDISCYRHLKYYGNYFTVKQDEIINELDTEWKYYFSGET